MSTFQDNILDNIEATISALATAMHRGEGQSPGLVLQHRQLQAQVRAYEFALLVSFPLTGP